jgi:hypothetical protein
MKAICAVAVMVLASATLEAQRNNCPPADWSITRLEELKRNGFKIADASERHHLALALPACLAHPDPAIRDGIAFEALSTWMRGGQIDHPTLRSLRASLLKMIAATDDDGFAGSFAALVLSEVARTDRLAAWLTAEERDETVRAAVTYLRSVRDYRAFYHKEGFRHAVAHGADLALQLVLNPLTTKGHIDQLLQAVAAQVAPQADVAYWAGEPDRLARVVVFAAQRKLHTGDEWSALFTEIANAKPLKSWQAAFTSEAGIKKRHNVRAFLLSVYAAANTSEDTGVRGLIAPATAALKAVQ